PYDKSYASKPDFAQVEYRFPLSTAQRAQVTPEYLARLDQEQLDQLYARLTAGPIPNGSFDGRVIFPRGASGTLRAAEVMGEFASTVLQLKGLAVEGFAEFLWKGKVFYRDQRIVRNRIEDR